MIMIKIFTLLLRELHIVYTQELILVLNIILNKISRGYYNNKMKKLKIYFKRKFWKLRKKKLKSKNPWKKANNYNYNNNKQVIKVL